MNSDYDGKLMCVEEPPLQKRQKLDNDEDARTSTSASGMKQTLPAVMMNSSGSP